MRRPRLPSLYFLFLLRNTPARAHPLVLPLLSPSRASCCRPLIRLYLPLRRSCLSPARSVDSRFSFRPLNPLVGSYFANTWETWPSHRVASVTRFERDRATLYSCQSVTVKNTLRRLSEKKKSISTREFFRDHLCNIICLEYLWKI